MAKSWLTLFVLSGLVWLGFVFHTSSGDALLLGKYSTHYGAFLAILTVVWLFILWWGWRKREKLGSLLRIAGLNILLTLIILLVTLPLVFIYMHQKSLAENVLNPLNPDAHAFFQLDKAPEFPEQGSANVIKVLTLGGSTTYGSRLERSQAYPAVLQALLEERYPDTRFDVFNAGVPWHTSMHSLLRYVALYAEWKPDVVIVMHAFNDIFQTSEGKLTTGKFRGDYGHFFGALGLRVNPKDPLSEDVHRLLFNNWFARTWYSDLFPQQTRQEKKPVDLLRALPHFRRNICQLVKRARSDGAEVVLLTQPSVYREGMSEEEIGKLFYDYYYRDYARIPHIQEQSAAMVEFNREMLEVADSCGALLVDLEQHIPKDPEYMYDDVHYTVEGARQVAGTLLDEIPWERYLSMSRNGEKE